jgi:hypothetical protein
MSTLPWDLPKIRPYMIDDRWAVWLFYDLVTMGTQHQDRLEVSPEGVATPMIAALTGWLRARVCVVSKMSPHVSYV